VVVRVLPDEPAIDKLFDYAVPDAMVDAARTGAVVRVELHGRRVGGWIVDAAAEPEPGVTLRPLAKVSGWGPSADVIELARWAAWRWAGRPASFLRTASPEKVVRALPDRHRPSACW
jgi:primosomal protein N' (replication factor Y)